MKIIFDVRLVFPSLLFVCSLFPQRTEAASQLCSAGECLHCLVYAKSMLSRLNYGLFLHYQRQYVRHETVILSLLHVPYAGASHGDGCTLSAHCVGSGVALEWETVGYPQVDVLHLEYQKNNVRTSDWTH